MAITGPSSYVSTTVEFISHWGLANAALGAGNEILLADNVNLTVLISKKTALFLRRSQLQTKLTELEVARGAIEVLKQTLLDLFKKLTDRVRALYPKTKWERAIPLAPAISEGLGNFIDPMETASSLWKMINDDATLPDIVILGVTQTQFATQIADLIAAYAARSEALTVATVTREERNDLQDEIYAILKNYRQAVPTHFATGHAMVDSLPRLTPEPGSTPEAVTANGAWVPAQNQARITFTRSDAADFVEYELRMTPGPDYSTEDDVVVATIGDQDTLEFLTDFGLTTPGMAASFKVFVKTATGNEAGSNTVVITRPL